MASTRQRLRDPIGHALFWTGGRISRFGLWLCGLSGTWDSRTDHPLMVGRPDLYQGPGTVALSEED